MDYDIGVVGLASPPAQAVVTSYRPAVSVRNNGIHDAIASGYLRIYAAGLLVFETEVYSGTLAPGATGSADAVDYWTPEHEGQYIVQGYVSTPLDQIEPNNNLNPVTIIVAGGPVPPTPTVPLHAAQHEEGSTDPINVDGLPGVLKDRQLPSAHAAQHQAGQADVLNVAGLAGVLGEAQTPQVHGNAHHNPVMTTAAELTAHAGAVAAHTAATNLANRETTGDDAGLVKYEQIVKGTRLPSSNYNALLADRFLGAAKHASIGYNRGATTIVPGTGRQTILSIPLPYAWISNELQIQLELAMSIFRTLGLPGTTTFSIWLDTVVLAAITANLNIDYEVAATLRSTILAVATDKISTSMLLCGSALAPTPSPIILVDPGLLLRNRPLSDSTILLDVEFDGDTTDRYIELKSGFVRALSPIP